MINPKSGAGGFGTFTSFGGRQAALYYLLSGAACRIGVYRRYRTVHWAGVGRVVFVCSGNVCRSPYAEVKVRRLGIDAVSCGTTAIDGAGADTHAKRVARERSVDLSVHSSSRVASIRFSPADLILVLEPRHLAYVRPVAAAADAQVSLLGLWCTKPVAYIPDPFGTADSCFRFVFDLIDDAISNIQGLMTANGTPNSKQQDLRAQS